MVAKQRNEFTAVLADVVRFLAARKWGALLSCSVICAGQWDNARGGGDVRFGRNGYVVSEYLMGGGTGICKLSTTT